MSGLKRLFWALTLLWALFWMVVYPMDDMWKERQRALLYHNERIKACASLGGISPVWDNCVKTAEDDYQSALKFYFFKRFWVLPVALWQLFLPLIVIPPAIVYGLGALGAWVRRGFKPRTKYT